MVGGKIEDFKVLKRQQYVSWVGPDSWDIDRANERFDEMEAKGLQLVRFLVNDGDAYCCVMAAIPQRLLGLHLVEKGQQIWWQSGKVYLTVLGDPDHTFTKVGWSGGNKESFYRAEKLHT